MKDNLLLSRREAADALGISVDTLARLITRGELGIVRVGRAVRIPADDVLALVERGGAPTGRRRVAS